MLKFFKKNNEKGFTLIELLVVIAIIGVLSSIVLASLNNARKKSRDVRRISDVKQIQLALELYFDGQGGAYPASSATCTGTPTAADGENHGLQVLANKGYIPQIPRDPLSSASAPICYRYAAPASSITTYHLGATIEDSANTALNGDKDCDSTSGTSCPVASYSNGFAGADPVYDVVP